MLRLLFGGEMMKDLWMAFFCIIAICGLTAGSSGADEMTGKEIVGNLTMPAKWTVFVPGDRKMPALTPEKLLTIPKELTVGDETMKAQAVTPINNQADFAPLFGGWTQGGRTVYVFIPLKSSSRQEVTLGFGADWFMDVHLNGKQVLNTYDKGNGTWPANIDNHIAKVTLDRGMNVLAIRFGSGRGSSILAVGGPGELRKGPATSLTEGRFIRELEAMKAQVVPKNRREPGVYLREIFVAPDGSDSNPGTADQPFATIGKAAATARAGDKVQVRAGIYREQVIFPHSGEPGKPIVFTGERGLNGEWLTVVDPGVLVTGWEPAPEVGPGVYKTSALSFNPQVMTLNGKHLLRIADRHMELDKGRPAPVEPIRKVKDPLTREKEGLGGFWLMQLPQDAVSVMPEILGRDIPFWDGVEVIYGHVDGITYIRFRNGDNPGEKQLAAAGPGPAVLIDNRNHLVVRDFEVRGAEISVIIQGREATNNVIEHNYMTNGRRRVLVTRGAARNIVSHNQITLNYIGHDRPEEWDADRVKNSHIYQEFKHTAGGHMSDDQGITVSQAGPDNIVRDNRLDTGLIGIAVNETLRARVYRNVISHMSSIGLITERGTYDCRFYDNLLINNSINLRIHSYTSPGYPRREYHYRNMSYFSPDWLGSHIHFHYDLRSNPWPGAPEDPEIFIYHNTYIGGSNKARGHNLAVRNIYRHTAFVNNVFSTPGTSLAEWWFWDNGEFMEAADHNWLPAPAGRRNPSIQQPAWFGNHNIVNEGRLLWPAGTPDFILPEKSAARGGGLDLSKPFSICGRKYPALPGMEQGYFSGDAPDMGALQRGQALDPVMARELPAQ